MNVEDGSNVDPDVDITSEMKTFLKLHVVRVRSPDNQGLAVAQVLMQMGVTGCDLCPAVSHQVCSQKGLQCHLGAIFSCT